MDHGGAGTKLAGSSVSRERGRSFVVHERMLLADVIGGKDRYKRGRSCSSLDSSTPAGLLAFYQAHRPDDLKTEFASGLNGLHRGSAGGAHIIHDYHARAFFAKAFNPLSGAM